MLPEIFEDIPILLIGAHAAAAFAPERFTKDTDYLVQAEHYDDAAQRLRGAGWNRLRELVFPNAALGLLGSAWASPSGGNEVDLITSGQDWVREAFTAPRACDASGKRVIPLAYLILMKLDSARAIDQADLSRILGRLAAEDVADIIRTVEAHYHDPSAPDDIRQYHEIGKWEYEAGD